MGYEFHPISLYYPDLAPSDYFLFSNFRKLFAEQKFKIDEEKIAETTSYFEATDKSYQKNGIEKLYERYSRCQSTCYVAL